MDKIITEQEGLILRWKWCRSVLCRNWRQKQDYQDLKPVGPNTNLNEGKFAIVEFKGGKRMTTLYKYLCKIDLDKGEIKVMTLRSPNNDYSFYYIGKLC